MKYIYLSVIFMLLGLQLYAQSVYVCTATSVNVRDSNCTNALSFGQVSMPHSFVVLTVTGMNCDYNWYRVDIPNVHNHQGYPLNGYVATHYFSESTTPSHYLTVINSPNGVFIKNTPNGTPVWIKNPDYNAAQASFENAQMLARTPADPVQVGSETWYEVYLSPNCISDTILWLQQFTGWVGDGNGNGGPFLLVGVAGLPVIRESLFSVTPNPGEGNFVARFPAGTSEILILNSLGKELFRLDCSNESQKDIQLVTYPSGVYFVRFHYDNQWIIRKIVVVR